MFNSPHINEMMARATQEYRATEFENARRRQLVRAARQADHARTAPKRSSHRLIALLRRTSRKPA